MMRKALFYRTSVYSGVLFCLGFFVSTDARAEDLHTPNWSRPENRVTRELVQIESTSTAKSSSSGKSESQSSSGIRLLVYNVENWLSMNAEAKRRGYEVHPKPAKAKQAVVKLMLSNSPDVIGLSEIGTAGDLAEVQEMLKKGGLNLPHSHYGGGSDPLRRLGFLSKYPITATHKPADLDFKLNGKSYGMNRGVLDATIRAGGQSYRMLGVHLKSKREVRGVSQEDIRVHEARLLRRHVDSILKENLSARLIVYGDFNDTRPSKTFKTITGNYGTKDYLTAIPFKDSRGETWTHYWQMHDIYSRIDYVLVSQAMRKHTDFKRSYIIDDEAWEIASDHRPLLAIFR